MCLDTIRSHLLHLTNTDPAILVGIDLSKCGLHAFPNLAHQQDKLLEVQHAVGWEEVGQIKGKEMLTKILFTPLIDVLPTITVSSFEHLLGHLVPQYLFSCLKVSMRSQS